MTRWVKLHFQDVIELSNNKKKEIQEDTINKLEVNSKIKHIRNLT